MQLNVPLSLSSSNWRSFLKRCVTTLWHERPSRPKQAREAVMTSTSNVCVENSSNWHHRSNNWPIISTFSSRKMANWRHRSMSAATPGSSIQMSTRQSRRKFERMNTSINLQSSITFAMSRRRRGPRIGWLKWPRESRRISGNCREMVSP